MEKIELQRRIQERTELLQQLAQKREHRKHQEIALFETEILNLEQEQSQHQGFILEKEQEKITMQSRNKHRIKKWKHFEWMQSRCFIK